MYMAPAQLWMSIDNAGTQNVTLFFDENASVPNWKIPM